MTARRKFVAAALVLFFAGVAVCAQNPKHESQLKTVRGVVLDKSENPVAAGVVFLKNVRTNQVRSNITNDQGNYRFSGIDPNAEYELYAEKDSLKSQTRNISSFDSRMDIVLNLKLDKKKG
jgi:Carboxypeptidase regulatory-like domain